MSSKNTPITGKEDVKRKRDRWHSIRDRKINRYSLTVNKTKPSNCASLTETLSIAKSFEVGTKQVEETAKEQAKITKAEYSLQ